ncbi:hypothetical protein HYALB_00012395 [Hymenoscyphus albidus]|uniref:Uncharacterized protein n=1 Tax=Hymenoscyphus albidus TaxID=595503 RepID=A0A9N9LX54_9HELO|nr:hypothetical protein HYALB_00012395 [Hymenoscyphus albidus]
MDPQQERQLIEEPNNTFQQSTAHRSSYVSHVQNDVPRRGHEEEPTHMTILRSQYIERFPYNGFTAIIFAFASTIAAIFVLAEGTIVFCWNRALKGSTIKNLSRDWEMATNVQAALLASRHLNLVAIATIVVTLCAIIGPILQKVSTVTTWTLAEPVLLHGHVAPVLPRGFSAKVSSDLHPYPVGVTSSFAGLIRQMNYKNYTTDIKGCTGNCSGVIRGAGLVRTCNEPTYENWTLTWGRSTANYSWPVFQVSTHWDFASESYGNDAHERIELTIAKTTSMTTTDGPPDVQIDAPLNHPFQFCNALLSTTACNFTLAVMEYEFTMTDNNIQLLELQNIKKVEEVPGRYQDPSNLYGSTIAGLALYLQTRYALNVSMQVRVQFWEKPTPYDLDSLLVAYSLVGLDTSASQYVHGYDIDPNDPYSIGTACNYTWSDPMNDIMKDLNDLMFRSALYVGSTNEQVALGHDPCNEYETMNVSTKRDINATQTSEEVIFKTNFAYMAGGLVVMLVGILSVVPIFFGYWNLSHHTRLNPFDMAQAFHSTDLPGASVLPHMGLREPSGVIDGENKVFGVVTEDGKSKLMYEDPQSPTPTNTVEERMLERMSQQ